MHTEKKAIIIKPRFFDGHCDTILKVKNSGGSLRENNFHLDFGKLTHYDSPIITLAVFNEGNFFVKDIYELIRLIKKECEINSDISSYGLSQYGNRISVLSSIEGLGNTPDIMPSHIKDFRDMGVMFISLTWNQDNILCGGISKNDSGLTKKGKEILCAMEQSRMILDVSHISDRGFFECMENFGYKICATHSNSRSICPEMRNITDEQFRIIVSKKGICGINFYPEFLNSTKNATSDDIIRHIEHFLSLGGENHITLGTDFDGIEFTPLDITDCSEVYRLFDKLVKRNYSDSLIQKIAYKNFLNFINFEIF